MSHGVFCSAGAERERASSSGVSAFLKLKNLSGCRAAGVVQEITQQWDVISLLLHWKTGLFFFFFLLLLFLPNNRRYSCDALLVITLDFINASRSKGCNAHRLAAAFAPLSHVHYVNMSQWLRPCGLKCHVSSQDHPRCSSISLNSSPSLPLHRRSRASGGRSAQRRKRMNLADLARGIDSGINLRHTVLLMQANFK